MKANELMIGDWVFCEGQPIPSNVTIQSIAEDGVWFMGDKVEGAATFDRIFPIPLTPEILEKNGFSFQNWWRIENGNPTIYLAEHYGSWWLYQDDYLDTREYFAKIKYVHELQHALRLCGIDKEITI